MTFIYSLKLFKSNFTKALKLFLCYLVIWGVCICLLLPSFFEFSDILREAVVQNNLIDAFSGVFGGLVGEEIFVLSRSIFAVIEAIWAQNLGLAVYALIVIFVILPILLNLANYTFSEMLHSYMTSKRKLGFFSALAKGLKKSVTYAIERTVFGLLFYAILIASLYGLTLVENAAFIKFALPVVLFVVFVLCFTARQIASLGFMPALIVFNCSHVQARKKGVKAVSRHLASSFVTTFAYFVCFWAIAFVFGVFSLVVLIPIMAVLICTYNMTAFFCSQGMRFYFDNDHILTPKKLEEVDSIKKISAIL